MNRIPWSHEEHRLSLEMFEILIAEVLIMVVFEDFEAIGGLELPIIEGLEGDRKDRMDN